MTSVGESRRSLLGLAIVGVVAIVLLLNGFAGGAPRDGFVLRGTAMGTTYTVRLGHPLSSRDGRAVRALVEAELAMVDQLMSTYDPDSELSRFNRVASTRPFPLSPPTLEVLRLARLVSEHTNGAFDVTIAPLVAAWGFGATNRAPAPPTDEELAYARARVGFRLIDAGFDTGMVAKRRVGVVVDLSAIAKGYAVDRAIDALIGAGYMHALVEVGGDLRAVGRRPGGELWRLGIERPSSARREIQRVLSISGRALATSGDYRSYYESGGKRLSHLLDPRSGRPIENGVASVSVVHERAAVADAWATALSVLGPLEGIPLADEQGIAALFLLRRGDATEERWTSAFAPLMRTSASSAEGMPSLDVRFEGAR